MNWRIFSLLSSIFTHSVQDVRRHVLLPVIKEKKIHSINCIFIYRKKAALLPFLLRSNHRESHKNKDCCYVITLGWDGDLEDSSVLGVFIAVRIGGQEQVISWREHWTEWVFRKVVYTNVSLLRILWPSWTLQGPASRLIYRWVRVSGYMLIFKNSNMGKEWRNSVKNTQRHSDKEN